MEKLVVLGVAAAVAVVLIRPPQGEGTAQVRADFVAQDERSACLQRGIAYFREIGAWPRLASGADAFDEAHARCRRSVRAF